MRRADTLARYGAAELAFVLNDVAGEAECRLVAARVLEVVATLYRSRHAREPVCFYR